MNSRRIFRNDNTTTENIDSGQNTRILVIAEFLLETSIDQIATYEELSKVAGCDITTENRWLVLAALRHINKTHGVIFECQRGEGYRRLGSESGVKSAGERGVKRTRNAARAARRRLENAVHHANDLSPFEQRLANQRLATLGLVDHLTQAKIVKVMPDEAETPKDNLAGLRKALGL